jgi:hypothetical protein
MAGNEERKMDKQKYQCCFCGDSIIPNQLAVTGLTITTNWEKESGLQQEQQLFCHLECLRENLSTNVPLYVADVNE